MAIVKRKNPVYSDSDEDDPRDDPSLSTEGIAEDLTQEAEEQTPKIGTRTDPTRSYEETTPETVEGGGAPTTEAADSRTEVRADQAVPNDSGGWKSFEEKLAALHPKAPTTNDEIRAAELKDMMDRFEKAQAEAASRNAQLGRYAAAMGVMGANPQNVQNTLRSYGSWADEPTSAIVGGQAAAARQQDLAKGAYAQARADDENNAKSDVSQWGRTVVENFLNKGMDPRSPDRIKISDNVPMTALKQIFPYLEKQYKTDTTRELGVMGDKTKQRGQDKRFESSKYASDASVKAARIAGSSRENVARTTADSRREVANIQVTGRQSVAMLNNRTDMAIEFIKQKFGSSKLNSGRAKIAIEAVRRAAPRTIPAAAILQNMTDKDGNQLYGPEYQYLIPKKGLAGVSEAQAKRYYEGAIELGNAEADMVEVQEMLNQMERNPTELDSNWEEFRSKMDAIAQSYTKANANGVLNKADYEAFLAAFGYDRKTDGGGDFSGGLLRHIANARSFFTGGFKRKLDVQLQNMRGDYGRMFDTIGLVPSKTPDPYTQKYGLDWLAEQGGASEGETFHHFENIMTPEFLNSIVTDMYGKPGQTAVVPGGPPERTKAGGPPPDPGIGNRVVGTTYLVTKRDKTKVKAVWNGKTFDVLKE